MESYGRQPSSVEDDTLNEWSFHLRCPCAKPLGPLHAVAVDCIALNY